MKAIALIKYGKPEDVLVLQEMEKPVLKENRVLVKVKAASLNVIDVSPIKGALIARLLGTGFFKPKTTTLGTDIAGTVEAVGQAVTRFKDGDEVFGAAPGGFAEYASAREDYLVLKPSNVSFEEAACVPVAGVSALQGLMAGKIHAGQKVLIYGASGSVGALAIQIAKSFGTEVTAVCSTRNQENARLLGADHVIDYTKEDFAKNGQKYDLILAVNGYHSLRSYRSTLTPTGILVGLGGDFSQIIQILVMGPMLSKADGQKLIFMGIAKFNLPDIEILRDLLASGKIRPLIEKRYPLDETVKAVEYLMEGHAQGKLVIDVE